MRRYAGIITKRSGFRDVDNHLRNINNTVVLKDVVARYRVCNVSFPERLVEYPADNVGSPVSAKKNSDFNLFFEGGNFLPNGGLPTNIYLYKKYHWERGLLTDMKLIFLTLWKISK